ncbi:aldo/keto reductase [Bacteroidota bacterium]
MKYRKLGKTGLDVSILSYGASSLGGHFRSIREDESIRSVHTAIENGINLIDVSPYYGNLGAEKLLGKAFKDIPRDSFYLATKAGRYWNGEEKAWDYSPERVTKSVDESLERMGIDYIDIIQVHDVEFSDKEQIINETLPALHSVKQSGKVRHVGITGLPLEDLNYIIDRVDTGMVESILSFCHYSLNDDSLVDHLDFYEEKQVAVINAAPISMGLLSERGVPEWHPATPDVIEVCAKAAEYCKNRGEKIEKLAVQFSVNNPRISTTLVSSANPDNVFKNIKWTEEPINEELLEQVLAILKPVNRKTWENS